MSERGESGEKRAQSDAAGGRDVTGVTENDGHTQGSDGSAQSHLGDPRWNPRQAALQDYEGDA